jgi:putative serine protease PepD
VVERVPSSPARSAAQRTASSLSAQQIYSRASRSVAEITARTSAGGSFPFAPGGSSTSTGSGFVVSGSGLLATNAHVVDGASSISLTLDGHRYRARVVGKDESTDLALLRIDPGGRRLYPLAFAASSALRVGDAVAAIGSPYGLAGTLTTGVVSALHRSIEAPNRYTIANAIQTDASLNPGNSGGPLLDAAGRVIGVNAQIETGGDDAPGPTSSGGSTGVGFAIPSDTVRRVIGQLAATGRAADPWLGITTTDAASGGATVAGVRGGSPAQGHLRRGDVIVRFGTTAIGSSDDLGAAVDAHRPADRVTLQVIRDGHRIAVELQLGRRPQ